MKKVHIKVVDIDNYECNAADLEVFVDGKLVDEGYFGGEVEDNSRFRHYSWVIPMLEKLSTELGAEVTLEYGEKKEDE